MTVGSWEEKLWQIEVHLQCDLMSDGTMVECQSMDMHFMHGTALARYSGNPSPTVQGTICLQK